MNPTTQQLTFKDYVLLFIAVLTFFASLFCALRIPSNAPDIMASIGLGIVSILFFIVFILGKNQDEDSLLDIDSKLTDKHFDSFIHQYKDLLDLIFEQIETKDFSTMPLCDIHSYRDFLTMYATTQTKKLSLDRHEKIKFLCTQLNEIIKSHPLVPIPEPCPITVLQEEIKQKLEEQAVLPGSITRVEYDDLLDIPTPRHSRPKDILPRWSELPQSPNKVIFGVDANESGFAPTDPEAIPMPLLPLPAETIASFTEYEDLLITGKLVSKEQDGNPEPIYLGIPSVPDEEEMQQIKEKAATVATDIIAEAIGKSDDELMQSLKEEAFALTPTPEAEKELMQSLREEAIEAAFDISKDAIKASPKRTKSGRFAKKSK